MALSTSLAGCLVSFYYYYVFTEIIVFNTNSLDPDQMPHSVASDLSLHCFTIILLLGYLTEKEIEMGS